MMAQASPGVAVDIELQRATPAHRDRLVEMYRAFEPKGASLGLPPRLNPERWLDGLSKYPNFVALAGDRIVGHAVLCPCGSSGEVAVFVHQDYRSRGLGKRLLEELVREASTLGLCHVWGTTELDNVPMLRLAHSLGFVSGQDPATFSLDLTAGN